MSGPEPTERFSSRAADYLDSRPAYPPGILDILATGCGLRPKHRVADVGAGTGILTAMLLRNGNAVVAVEPNDAMRAVLERSCSSHPLLEVAGTTAEATGLPASSVDLVTVAQAFHWFDAERVRREFSRILRPGGCVALMWNVRDTEATGFLRGYESLLRRFAPEYERFKDGPVDAQLLSEFFRPGGFVAHGLRNDVEFDYRRLERLVRSTSYAPSAGQAGFAPMIDALRELFDAHQSGGKVLMRYQTRLFHGHCR